MGENDKMNDAKAGFIVRLVTPLTHPKRLLVTLMLFAPLSITAADRYWIAANGNWSDTANWSETSGGSGGTSVPGSSDSAIFDEKSGDCSIDSTININRLQLTDDYMGSVAQGAAQIKIGTGGYYQGSGTFSGGSAPIEINKSNVDGAIPFNLAGGTFTSTSDNLDITWNKSGVTMLSVTNTLFNHNSGTVKLSCIFGSSSVGTLHLDIRMPLLLYNLTFTGGNNLKNTFAYNIRESEGGRITVANRLTLENTYRLLINGGTIELPGDIVASGDLYGGTTKILFNGSGDQYYTHTDGRLPHFIINKPSGSVSPTLSPDLSISSLRLEAGTFVAPTRTLYLGEYSTGATKTGNIIYYENGNFLHNNGTVRLDQYIGASSRYDRTIYTEKLLHLHNLTFSGGNSMGSYLLGYNLSPTTEGSIVVANELSLYRSTTGQKFVVDGGSLSLHGNATCDTGSLGGDATIIFNGNTDQFYTTIDGSFPIFSIDKELGSVAELGSPNLTVTTFQLIKGTFIAPSGYMLISYANDMYIVREMARFVGGTFIHNNGTLQFALNIGSSNDRRQTIVIAQPLELANLSFTGGNTSKILDYTVSIIDNGALSVANKLIMHRSSDTQKLAVNGTIIPVGGDVTFGTGLNGGTAAIKCVGTGIQTITHTGGTIPQGHWTINKPAGAVTLATPLTLSGTSQDLLWQSGDIDLGTNTFTVGRNVTVSPGDKTLTTLVTAAGKAGNLTINGSVNTITNLTLRVGGTAEAKGDTKGRTYTVLSNKTALDGILKGLAFIEPWRAKVDYSQNEGKDITLYNVFLGNPASVLIVR